MHPYRTPVMRSPPPVRAGFTFPEMLTVMVLAALILVALQQALVGQLRFHESQRAVSERNESIRFGMGVLGTTLREASVAGGDVDVLAPDRLRARVPHGSAVVCGTDNNGNRVGIVDPRGQWAVGDSVIVHRSTGRHVDRIARVDPASPQVPCTVVTSGAVVRLDQRVADAVVGSGARPFRSQVFESVERDGAQWLDRVAGAEREVLAGPLDGVDGFTVWYEDVDGSEVPDLASADRVVVRLIARGPDIRGTPPLIRDTLLMRFGGRN